MNRGQLSFLITLFSMALVVLLLFNIHLGSQEVEEYVIELLAEEDLEELIEEEEQRLEEIAQANPVKSHMAYNETAKPSYGNPEPLKTLDELREEQSSEDLKEFASADTGYAASLKELAKKREEKKQLLGEREAQKEERTQNLADRVTSVSYSLVGRNSYRLPPPIYTCIEGGKVVINIEVNAVGNVVSAEFNKKSSGTANGCLVDNAITYAYRASFNSGGKASQKGTITYLFQGK